MIRLLFLLLFLTAVGFGAAWISDHPGRVVVHWFDWRIDTSFAFLMLMAFAVAWAIAYVYALIRMAIAAPKRFLEHRKLVRYQQGLSTLTSGVAALAASDPESAELYSRKARKLLGITPLGLLVSAQAAKNRGNQRALRKLLTAMLDYKETEKLAASSIAKIDNK